MKYNKQVLNSNYITRRRVVSAEIPCRSKHHTAENDSIGQIPNVGIIATGCRVVLTKYQ